MSVLTADLIKRSEENAVKSGISSFRQLMFTAGNAAGEIINNKYDCRDKKIAVSLFIKHHLSALIIVCAVEKRNKYDRTVIHCIIE